MTNFILIHGAWHGPESWHKIVPLLEANGHNITLINLYSIDKYNVSLQDYVDYVAQFLRDESVIVGHSMAGLILSSLTKNHSSKIKSLVYLCAFMLEDGQNLLDISSKFTSDYLKLEFADDFKICSICKESATLAFYNNCSKEDTQFAIDHLKPQTYKVFNNRIKIDSEKYKMLQKFYIKCTLDNAVSIEAQEYMLEKQVLTKTYSLNTDHSPFLSAHSKLSKILQEITLNE